MTTKTATTLDQKTIQYVETDDPPAGGMKKTYFAPDRSYVVQFFLDQSTGKDPNRQERLQKIINRFNPTLSEASGGSQGTDPISAEYFRKLFCWPTAIVVKPEIGIVAPTFPKNFFFADGDTTKGKEKLGSWFLGAKASKLVPSTEKGPWFNYYRICILLARAVRRLHQAGLAHSDLSDRNVLIDPKSGQAVIIDCDSLVVPGMYPPDVLGTAGYIAPEVLSTCFLPLNDKKRKHADVRTDQHALAVLLYQYLFHRHPLKGPKSYRAQDGEEQERLEMGEKALFIEHPSDRSNRPNDLRIGCGSFGPKLKKLFEQAFVIGLHRPELRPTAFDWETALVELWNLFLPCQTPGCAHEKFVLYDATNVRCPSCGKKPPNLVPILRLKNDRRGQLIETARVTVWDGLELFKWHTIDGVFPGETADRVRQAYVQFWQGQWILVNENLQNLIDPSGALVPPGSRIVLSNGARFLLSKEPNGRMAEVEMICP